MVPAEPALATADAVRAALAGLSDDSRADADRPPPARRPRRLRPGRPLQGRGRPADPGHRQSRRPRRRARTARRRPLARGADGRAAHRRRAGPAAQPAPGPGAGPARLRHPDPAGRPGRPGRARGAGMALPGLGGPGRASTATAADPRGPGATTATTDPSHPSIAHAGRLVDEGTGRLGRSRGLLPAQTPPPNTATIETTPPRHPPQHNQPPTKPRTIL